MDWVTSTGDRSQAAASVKNAFEVVRQKPLKLTQRLSKLAQRRSGRKGDSDDEEVEELPQDAGAISEADLAAFPALCKQEGIESRRARVQAYHATVALIQEKYAAFCEACDHEVFEQLWHEFVLLQDPSKTQPIGARGLTPPLSGAPSTSGQGHALHGLPAAVLSARGIGSEADNGGMYQRLLKYLQNRKAYSALLHAKDLSAGVSSALHTMLQQFMGAGAQDWGADDIQALYAWYADQTGVAAAATATVAPAAPADPAAATAGPSTSKEGAEAAEKRQLRQRKSAGAGKGKQQPPLAPVADLFAPQKKVNRTRPLVLLIQGTEQADLSVLRAFTKLLLQDYARLPVCLLLGTSTPADVLISSFSVDVCSRLCVQLHHMPPQDQRLHSCFQDVLLGTNVGGPLPLALAGPPVQLLLDRYSTTDGSVGGIIAALELAAFEHCRGAPLVALAATALSGADVQAVAAVAATLPQDVVAAFAAAVGAQAGPGASAGTSAAATGAKTKRAARSGAGAAAESDEATGPLSSQVMSVATAVAEAAATWASWRLGLLWTCKLAETTGASRRPEFQLPALYSASSDPSFLPSPSTQSAPRPGIGPSAGLTAGTGAISPGQQLLARLTGAAGSISVRSLSSPVDQASLTCLLDELLFLGEKAAETWPSACAIQTVTAGLRKLLQDELQTEGGAELQETSPLRHALQSMSVAASAAATAQEPAAGGSLLSPVRQALQSVRIRSPNAGADAAAAPAAGAGQVGAPGAVANNGATAGAAPGAAGANVATKPLMLSNAARKQARAAALLSAGQATDAKPQAGLAPAAGTSNKRLQLQERAAEFLHDALWQLLGSCPFQLPGASAFAYSRTWELESMLTFAPRAAVHEALLRPHVFLGGPEQDLGGTSAMEDAALAYRLLLGQDAADVGQWFEEFCGAVTGGGGGREQEGSADDGGEEEEEPAAGRRGRGAARGRRKGRRLSPDGGAVPRKGTSHKRAPDNTAVAPTGLSAMSVEQAEAAALAAAARFSQAVAELQFVGICRASKRRKQATMQRCYYAPETLL